jgi:K+/H+ antiporter YhaU regulatory subunit KhtT
MVFNPGPGEKIEGGDVLIAMGSNEALTALENRVRKMR